MKPKGSLLFKNAINPNLRGLKESPTLKINERCRKLQERGQKVYNLGLGQSPFPVPRPLVEALRLNAEEKNYLPVKGLPALRTAVADFYRRKYDLNASPENVIIGPGSKELLFLLQLVFSGEIIIPTPSWVSYVPQAKILGRNIHFLHTTFEKRWKIQPEELARALKELKLKNRPCLLILNYPGNPSGLTYSEKELAGLADVVRSHKVIVLSDEIYAGIHHRGAHVSLAKLYPEGTIVSSGLSKWCGAAGWRLGTFIFPNQLTWLMDAMSVVVSESYTSVSGPIQYAAVEAFKESKVIENYLFQVRRILSVLGAETAKVLTESGVRLHSPEGAFYLFADFSPLRDSLRKLRIDTGRALCDRLLADTGVALLPGEDFNRGHKELTARLAYVNFDGAKALAASEKLSSEENLPASFTRTWCKDTITAVERIRDWTKGAVGPL